MQRNLIPIVLVGILAGTTRIHAAEPQLAHTVFFTLEEDTKGNRTRLVAACQKHLSGHEGAVYFSAGTLAEELNREVNEQEFDVSLHLVFANKKAHDTYQTHPRHLKFIEENKHLWSKVRVFDSYLPQPANDDIPAEAKGFAGMIRGKVVGTKPGQLIVSISKITNVWQQSKAENPKSLVGKKVIVQTKGGEGVAAQFVNLVKTGESLELDIANKEANSFYILELTEDQRKRVKEQP